MRSFDEGGEISQKKESCQNIFTKMLEERWNNNKMSCILVILTVLSSQLLTGDGKGKQNTLVASPNGPTGATDHRNRPDARNRFIFFCFSSIFLFRPFDPEPNSQFYGTAHLLCWGYYHVTSHTHTNTYLISLPVPASVPVPEIPRYPFRALLHNGTMWFPSW